MQVRARPGLCGPSSERRCTSSSRRERSTRRETTLGVCAGWRPGPPPGPHAFEEHDARVRDAERLLSSLYPSTVPKLLAGFEALRDLHPAEPHRYLFFVGLEPAQQGKGLGESLLAPVLNRADAGGTLCYLETPFSGTLRFYRRLGFEVISELQPFEAPFPVWTMLRRPR